eukprot:6844256-Heterocapsa_arctica.AAC.1
MLALRMSLLPFPELLRLFHVLASEGDNWATGGVVTLVSRKWCDGTMRTSHEQIVRVSRVLISDERRHIVFWNIHNFAILDCMLARISCRLKDDLRSATLDPTNFT